MRGQELGMRKGKVSENSVPTRMRVNELFSVEQRFQPNFGGQSTETLGTKR